MSLPNTTYSHYGGVQSGDQNLEWSGGHQILSHHMNCMYPPALRTLDLHMTYLPGSQVLRSFSPRSWFIQRVPIEGTGATDSHSNRSLHNLQE